MNIRTFVTILSRKAQCNFPKMRGGVKSRLELFRKFIRSVNLTRPLGMPHISKTDEFSEKFQTAFDPPPHFRKVTLRFSRQKCNKSAYVHMQGHLCIMILFHHFIKQQISVLGSRLFLCPDFDHFFLVHSCESILVRDWEGFKQSRLYFWMCLGTFCILLAILVVGKTTAASKKWILSAFQWTLSFWNPSNSTVYMFFNLRVSNMVSVFKIEKVWQLHIFNSLNAGWISNYMVGIPTT